MKSIHVILLFMYMMIALVMWSTPVHAQTSANQVTIHINFSEYDVIFLTDFIDVKTQKLSSSISGFSVELNVGPSLAVPLDVKAHLVVQVQLRGDPRLERLVEGDSKQFTITERRKTLTANDFAKGGSGIAIIDQAAYENTDLKKRITDLAQTVPTAPPGTYQITLEIRSTNGVTVYGRDSKTIVIPYSSVDEVFVEINEPKDGSYLSSLAPTFSWTTGAPRVIVRVYEAGRNHRSPQDALTGGNPHLVKELSGVTTLTYPADAARQLEENKAYVLQVEAKISTNRGEQGNASRPVVFRITDDKLGKILDNFMNGLDGATSAPYVTLRSDPTNWVYWSPYGNVTLDGGILTEADVQTLLNELMGRADLKLELGVENQ